MADTLKHGDQVWLIHGVDVLECEVVAVPGEIYSTYVVSGRYLREHREFRGNLYRRPAQLEDLVTQLEDNLSDLKRTLAKFEAQLSDEQWAAKASAAE